MTKRPHQYGPSIDSDENTRPERRAQPGFPPDSPQFLLRTLIDCVPDYLFIKDSESRFVIANRAVADDLGCSVAGLIGKTDFDLHSRECAEKFFADEQAIVRSQTQRIDTEEFLVTSLGQKKWLATTKLPLRAADGEISGIVGVCRDITERKRVEEALIESESRWNFALEGAGQGVWDHNLKAGTAYYSSMWRKMRGIGPDDIIDPSREAWLERVHPDDRERLIFQTRQQNAGTLLQNSFEYRERHRDGHYIWILSRGKPVEFLPDGSVARIIGTDTDISSLKRDEVEAADEKERTYRKHLAALEREQEATEAAHRLSETLARHDALTGLPNRRVFTEVLNTAIGRATHNPASFCVMIVDLDGFKPVNDVNGHAVGDAVLCEIATRLGNLLGARDTVARLGGDEFGIVLEDVAPAAATQMASDLAERIINSIGQPISVGDQTVEVGASVGISICPSDGTDSDTLLRAADIAMYCAKEAGRGTFCIFEHTMEAAVIERLALEHDVRRAVTTHEILPGYLPLMLLTEKRLVGFEIIARWDHPARGEIRPEVFIPVVERLNLAGPMTYDLLRHACLDAREWPPEIGIAIHISLLHLSDALLPVKLLAILSETGLAPTRLEIGITEAALVADIGAAREALVALQEIGIKISLEDFAAGYASLYNLRDLRFDKIKIHGSFASSTLGPACDDQIANSVICLARSLGIPVIAEGLGNQQELEQTITRGAKYGQGVYFGEAITAFQATEMVRRSIVRPRKALS